MALKVHHYPSTKLAASIHPPPPSQKALLTAGVPSGEPSLFRTTSNCLEMSRNKGPKLNLIVPPTSRGGGPSRPPAEIDSPSSSSSESSCVSSESEKQPNSPEAAAMVLAGCPRCLMYVMLSEKEPKCPKCNSTVLLDFNTTRGT